MKKCPKCGTVLDDSKKKCYMCGAELLKTSSANFGDSFNAQIGATMSTGQDNVFNNSTAINDSVNNNAVGDIGNSRSTSNQFQNQLNGLNSLQYDDRTNFEKMLDNNDKKKKEKKSNTKKQNVLNNTAAFSSNDNTLPNNNFSNDFKAPVQQQNNQPEPLKNNPSINWGDNLGGSNKDVFKFRDTASKNKESGFNLSVLFNFICFIICVGGIAFVYFKFIKVTDSDEVISFGGLNYKIDEKLVLKTDDSHSRYYTYGDNCAIRINYGVTTNPDGFIESYFEKVKETYANKDEYNTSIQKLTINDNEWSEVSVQGIKENAAATNGYSFYSKYKHIAIVYEGNYFDIVYANTEDDSTCSAMYDSLIKSFSFE